MWVRFAKYTKDDYGRAWASIREDMAKKLAEGSLVSMGVAVPHTPNKEEVQISKHEWRIMEIDPLEETAVGKRDGEVKYVGIIISRSCQ
jgi:hypothetical protein